MNCNLVYSFLINLQSAEIKAVAIDLIKAFYLTKHSVDDLFNKLIDYDIDFKNYGHTNEIPTQVLVEYMTLLDIEILGDILNELSKDKYYRISGITTSTIKSISNIDSIMIYNYTKEEMNKKDPEYKDLLHIIIMCCRVIRSKRGDDYVEILKMTYPNKKYADLLDPVVQFI